MWVALVIMTASVVGGVSRTDWRLAEDMDTEMVMMMMNSAPMQMMQHDRMSLLNNPSREINQHGRGQTAISCSTTHHKKVVCGYGRPECEKERRGVSSQFFLAEIVSANYIIRDKRMCHLASSAKCGKGYYYLRIELYLIATNTYGYILLLSQPSQNPTGSLNKNTTPRPSYRQEAHKNNCN